MTDQKIYADNFRCTFDDPGDFIQFLKERKENSRWMTAPSRNLVFESLEKNTQMGELYLKLYDHDGRAEIVPTRWRTPACCSRSTVRLTLCDPVQSSRFWNGPAFPGMP